MNNMEIGILKIKTLSRNINKFIIEDLMEQEQKNSY